MVANDYFLRSRMIRLQDRLGDECACFSATVSGVSADLQASLQALIFSVALDPAAQICNRMPCPLELSTVDGPVVIRPGADIDILKPSQQLQLSLQAPISTGLSDEPVRLHLATGLWADRLPREKHQKQLIFEGDEKEKKDRDDKEPPRLVATLETEPGLTMSESWAPLQARRAKVRSLVGLVEPRRRCRCVSTRHAPCGSSSSRSASTDHYVGGCQHHGPFVGPYYIYYNTAPSI